ncbi:hypothetical protein FB566_3230 [Stackebrandtia endophytica]|uniref:Uncharacterized protein n=1 Tax=Stackebrandtia endophytica TaxID=1496996 RepID=A0A543AYL0_9ACTN|nr:hypothetical protein [Stackebrandtia endophytica]TQL77669.1 hypothetical protein FB566_3230 [Stackebrandtia endophytica]
MTTDSRVPVLLHRIGHSGTAVTPHFERWDFKAQRLKVKRPPDGRPAIEFSVVCTSCRERIGFRIFSEQAIRQRKALWRWCTVLSLIGAVAAVVLLVLYMANTAEADRLIIPTYGLAGALIAGLGAAAMFGSKASREAGVVGRGTSATLAKHQLEVWTVEEIDARLRKRTR